MEMEEVATAAASISRSDSFENSCVDGNQSHCSDVEKSGVKSSSNCCAFQEEFRASLDDSDGPSCTQSNPDLSDCKDHACSDRYMLPNEICVVVENEIEEWPAPPAFVVDEASIRLSTSRIEATPAENVDIILQRLLRERSSELSTLQTTSRPVTGSNARESLTDFFDGHNQQSDRTVNQQRSLPEDVQNLVQRSIVTSALRRHAFRSALEESLAMRIGSINSGSQSMQRTPQQARSTASGTPSTHFGNHFDNDSLSVASDSTVDQTDVSDAASDIEQLQRAVNVGAQMLRETIEEDLTHLHHLHVVSSALGGDFRTDLERIVQERAVSVGGGELVQRFIRSLPTNPHPPHPAAINQTFTAPSAAGPRQSSTVGLHNLSSEVHRMKQQMDEMKQMMQMQLEMQMDTQRAIRQEVAAVFSAFMQHMQENHVTAGQPSYTTQSPSRNSSAVSEGACAICMDNQIDTVLYQCGHMCVCNGCAIQLKMQGQRCPVCRAPIRDVIRAYKAQ